jgi:hypothetical protein
MALLKDTGVMFTPGSALALNATFESDLHVTLMFCKGLSAVSVWLAKQRDTTKVNPN